MVATLTNRSLTFMYQNLCNSAENIEVLELQKEKFCKS